MELMKWAMVGKNRLPPDPSWVGWYGIAYSWDESEGIFVGAAKWDGATWSAQFPIKEVSRGAFDSEEEAAEWARNHDLWS